MFISYARESEARARVVFEALKGQGVKAYLFAEVDRCFDGRGDDDVERLLRDRLSHSDALLVINDSHHVCAEWCGWELETFAEIHGSGALVFVVRHDHTPPLVPVRHFVWAPDERYTWPPSAATPPASPPSGRASFWLLLTDASRWSSSQNRPLAGFRLFGRNARAERRPRTVRHGANWPTWLGFLALQLVAFGTAALVGALGEIDAWQRQLALVLGLCGFGTALLATFMDLPAALTAGTFASVSSLTVTWSAALAEDAACDDMLAGGVAAGALVGVCVAVRLRQRSVDPPVSRSRAWVFFGLGSAGASLGLLWLIFRFTAVETFECLVRKSLGVPCSAASDDTIPLGVWVGISSGLLGAFVIGRARATNARGRLRLRAAILPGAAAFGVLTGAGVWSTSVTALALVKDSPLYGMNMGLIAAMVLFVSFCFHAAMSGWSQRTGDDAIFGLIGALLVLPILRDAVPAFKGADGVLNWSTLRDAYYVAVPASALLTYAALPPLASVLGRAAWGAHLPRSFGLHWTLAVLGSVPMLLPPPVPEPWPGPAPAPSLDEVPAPPPLPLPLPSPLPDVDKEVLDGGEAPLETPRKPRIISAEEGSWEIEGFEEAPKIPAPPATIPVSDKDWAVKLADIYDKDQRLVLEDLKQATNSQLKEFWGEVYKRHPERLAIDLENNRRYRIKRVQKYVEQTREALRNARESRNRLEGVLDKDAASVAPDDVEQFAQARARTDSAVSDAERSNEIAEKALADAPGAVTKKKFPKLVGASQRAEEAAVDAASRAGEAARTGEDAAQAANKKLRDHRKGAQNAWRTSRGGLVSGSAGGHNAIINVGPGMRLTLRFRIDAGNRVDVIINGCGVSTTLHSSGTVAFPVAPEPGCTVQIRVPGSRTAPRRFNLDGGSAGVGFEDAGDGDNNEPDMNMSATNAWLPAN